MKFSEFWIREWVNPPIKIDKLVNQISLIGFDVKNVKKVSENFNGITGKIIFCKKKKKKYYIKIDIGSDIIFKICKKKYKIYTIVVISIIGKNINVFNMYNKNYEYIICTKFDIGISCLKRNKIFILPKNTPIGLNVRKYLKLNDNIIDIEIPENRYDCLSVIGISREISAYNSIPINIPKFYINKKKVLNSIPVKIKSKNKCLKCLTRILYNVDLNLKTPFIIKEKLRRLDIICKKDILSNLVKYINIELGIPLYLINLNNIDEYLKIFFLKKKRVFCKSVIKKNTLVIKDKNKILFTQYKIYKKNNFDYKNKQNILIFSPFYNPKIFNKNITNSISFLNRYKKGIDYEIQELAVKKITNLLFNYSSNINISLIKKINYIHLYNKNNKFFILNFNYILKKIGFSINYNLLINKLKNLGYRIYIKKKNICKVYIPSWRYDINIKEDIITDIVRIFNHNKIESNEILVNNKFITENKINLLNRLKLLLVDRGYQEIITNILTNNRINKMFFKKKKIINILNPISKNYSCIRSSLIIGLIEVIKYNIRYQKNKYIKLFEIGYCYYRNKKTLKIKKNILISGLISISNNYKNLYFKNKISSFFFNIKGDVEVIFKLLNKSNICYKITKKYILHPKRNSNIYINNKYIGYIGELNPKIKSKLNIKNNLIMIFEFKWNKIKYVNNKKILYDYIEKNPIVYRDISIISINNLLLGNIINKCKKRFVKNIKDVQIIDIYENDNINNNYKYLTLRIFIQSGKRKINKYEINMFIRKILYFLKKKYLIKLRDKKSLLNL